MNLTSESLAFQDRSDWRAWLDVHHASATETWLVIQKKRSLVNGLFLDEAVEEALCFGWIDGQLRRRDEHSCLLRFSPRRANSIWSARNIARVARLIDAGLMTEGGLQKVRAARQSGQWQAALDRENVAVIPPDLLQALRRRKGALAAYRALPPSRKKHHIYALQSARREETRRRRIEEIVNELMGA